MPLQKSECYTITCDVCGEDLQAGDGYIPHYPTENEARGEASEMDWVVWEEHYWCDRGTCLPNCVCGHLFGEHEYGEHPCQETDCTCQGFQPAKEDN